MDLLLRRNALEMPPSLIQQEAEARLRHGVEMMIRRGVNPETADIDWAGEMGRAREAAERDLRADWLLELTARQKGIETSDTEISEEIAAMARERNVTPAALRQELEKNKQISSLRASMRRRRALDLLRSGATISVE